MIELEIPLRWEHLTKAEKYQVDNDTPESYERWELEFGYFLREYGKVVFVEDSITH